MIGDIVLARADVLLIRSQLTDPVTIAFLDLKLAINARAEIDEFVAQLETADLSPLTRYR